MAERKTTAKTKPSSPQKKPSRCLSAAQSLHPFPLLQRTLGNQRLLQLAQSNALQAKLKISRPNDSFEQEADRVAERVMRMPAPSEITSPISEREREPLIQRDTWEPYEPEEGLILEEDQLLTKRSADSGSEPPVATESQFHPLRGGGFSLPSSIRAWIEPRFGYDFSRVQLHTDLQASRLAESVHARAFTYGPHLVFGAGEYAPETEAGRQLLAHELVHVVQQGKASPLAAQAQAGEVSERSPAGDAGISRRVADPDTIHRVVWHPNSDTGRDSEPWGAGSPRGDILNAATDAGTAINTWRPHDGTTYWCHGYTFGGKTARGGPYSVWGVSVPTILSDDGWQRVPSCVSSNEDILVFYDDQGRVTHSGIIRSVSEPGGRVDETASTLESKWGSGSHNTGSWETNAAAYGKYRSYSKSPAQGPCSDHGANELP
jgi:hypothetical protein